MEEKDLEKYLRHIEAQGNDDLHLLQEVGAQYFSTTDLQVLLQHLNYQSRYTLRLRKTGLYTLLSIGFATATAYRSFAAGRPTMAYAFLCLIPLALILFALGWLQLRKKHETIQHASKIRRTIIQELDRRKKDPSVY